MGLPSGVIDATLLREGAGFGHHVGVLEPREHDDVHVELAHLCFVAFLAPRETT
jgi:hypothetical protein